MSCWPSLLLALAFCLAITRNVFSLRLGGLKVLYHATREYDETGRRRPYVNFIPKHDKAETALHLTPENASEHQPVAAGSSPLVEYCATHGLDSAEVVPASVNTATSYANEIVYVKTVIFQAKGSPFAAVLRDDLVADAGRMAQHFGVPRRQVTLAGAAFVEELTGFEVGTIPPLAHRTRVPILVDKGLLQYSAIIGGAGCSGFDSRLSVDDLLKGTGADVIDFARPKKQNSVEFSASNGVSRESGSGGGGSNTDMWFLEDSPTFIRSPTFADTAVCSAIDTSGASSTGIDSAPRVPVGEAKPSAAAGVGVLTLQLQDAQPQALGARLGSEKGDVDRGYYDPPMAKEQTAGVANAAATLTAPSTIESTRVASADASLTEAKLRVVAAAMRAVAAALSALADAGANETTDGGQEMEDQVEGGSRMTATGVKIPPAPVSRNATTSIFDWRSGDEPLRAHTEGNIGAVKESSASRANYVVVPQGEGRTTVSEWRDGGGGPGARGLVQDVTNVAARTESGSEKRAEDATAVKSSASEAAAPIGEMNDLRTSVGNGTKNDAAVAAMVGAEVAARMAPAGNFGRVLARAVGTPTVDAISGDVHLVAVVGGKRSLTRLLHFVDLVPPMEPLSMMTKQTCMVRKSWMGPPTANGSPPRPVQVQLIMGKTLVAKLGEEEARIVMRGVKRGQLLYVTGRPTPDTRLRFSGEVNDEGGGQRRETGTSAPCLSTDGANADTYDLVCCSVRLLEDAPVVEAALVGKGDDWEGKEGEFLRMDLPETAVTYVGTAEDLQEMDTYLQETLFRNVDSAMPQALAVDCEWRPIRRAGEKKNPVSLLQLAAGERTFLVDMLYVCSSRTEAAATRAASVDHDPAVSTGLTNTESLLEEALVGVLGTTEVVKVGMGPKTDFLSLVRSYPHLTCFRRVLGVVDLADVARNASSLRGKPAEEKGSLSRLSGIVLGKRLDKREQCSDWGTRPLSGRQKRYAALDARATLLLYQKLAPQVPATRMKSLFCAYTFDSRVFEINATRTPPPYASHHPPGSATILPSPSHPSATPSARNNRWRGGASRERLARKKMLGLSVIDVSEASLDVEGLRERWLGRPLLPDLTKEGVVMACIHPAHHAPASGVLGPVLRFNRHQSFVEFDNGFALLINCGGGLNTRENTSGFLDENGSTAVWYLQGTLSDSDANMGVSVMDSSLRSSSSTHADGSSALNSANGSGVATGMPTGGGSGGVGGEGGEDSIGRFLRYLAMASDTPSSILGDLSPEELDIPLPSSSSSKQGREQANAGLEGWANQAIGDKGRGDKTSGVRGRGVGAGDSSSSVSTADENREYMHAQVQEGEHDERKGGGGGESQGKQKKSTNAEGDGGSGSCDSGGGGGGGGGGDDEALGQFRQPRHSGVETPTVAAAIAVGPPPPVDSTRRHDSHGGGSVLPHGRQPHLVAPSPHLVLFARAKGRPFVYCGEVDCVGQEYVWSAGSTRLGAVRLTLALREWREAAAGFGSAGGDDGWGGMGADEVDMYRKSDEFRSPPASVGARFGEEAIDGFATVVREGLKR